MGTLIPRSIRDEIGWSPSKYSLSVFHARSGWTFPRCSSALLALIILQMWGATAVFAEWEFVDGNEQAKVYVDPKTVTGTVSG